MEAKKGLKPGTLTSKLIQNQGDQNTATPIKKEKDNKITVELVGQDKVIIKTS